MFVKLLREKRQGKFAENLEILLITGYNTTCVTAHRYAMKREVAALSRFFRGVCPILNRAITNENFEHNCGYIWVA
jgi:hypothetical protein